jgi:hypothetical protein
MATALFMIFFAGGFGKIAPENGKGPRGPFPCAHKIGENAC